jgi:hypothetical protein
MRRLLTTGIGILAFTLALANPLFAQPPAEPRQPPTPPDTPKKVEPPIVGTWKGEVILGGTRWKLTTTLRADKTYKTVMEYGNYVVADKGTYKYSDGILTTEPEGGLIATFTVTFVDKNTMKLKGEGFAVTLKRE